MLLPISADLMGKPFMANICVLEGFEDLDPEKVEIPPAIKAKFEEELPMFETVKILTLEKKDTRIVIKIPSLKNVKPEDIIKKEDENGTKEAAKPLNREDSPAAAVKQEPSKPIAEAASTTPKEKTKDEQLAEMKAQMEMMQAKMAELLGN